MSATDRTPLGCQAYEVWEKKATFWDEELGEGNAFQRMLVGSAAE